MYLEVRWEWGRSLDQGSQRSVQAGERKKAFALIIAPRLLRRLQNGLQLQFRVHFLEDRAELMHITQCEMDFGDGEDTTFLPNPLRVSPGIRTTPVLDTDHRLSRVLTPRHSEVPSGSVPLRIWESWVPTRVGFLLSSARKPFAHL